VDRQARASASDTDRGGLRFIHAEQRLHQQPASGPRKIWLSADFNTPTFAGAGMILLGMRNLAT